MDVTKSHLAGVDDRIRPYPAEGLESAAALLTHPVTNGFEITNVALVARVPDVVAAVPGVLFAAEMPSATHQFRRY